MSRPSGCIFEDMCSLRVYFFANFSCLRSLRYAFQPHSKLCSLRVHNLKIFRSYFMFSQGQGQVVRAAQPRQSWYLVPPPPPCTARGLNYRMHLHLMIIKPATTVKYAVMLGCDMNIHVVRGEFMGIIRVNKGDFGQFFDFKVTKAWVIISAHALWIEISTQFLHEIAVHINTKLIFNVDQTLSKFIVTMAENGSKHVAIAGATTSV